MALSSSVLFGFFATAKTIIASEKEGGRGGKMGNKKVGRGIRIRRRNVEEGKVRWWWRKRVWRMRDLHVWTIIA